MAVLAGELGGKFHLGQVLGAKVREEFFAAPLVHGLQARGGLVQRQDGLRVIQVKGRLEGGQEARRHNLQREDRVKELVIPDLAG